MCAGKVNVALGASCSASVSINTCSQALDGVADTIGNAGDRWSFRGQADGQWFYIDFEQTVTLTSFRVQQLRQGSDKNFNSATVEFSDGSSLQVSSSVLINDLKNSFSFSEQSLKTFLT